MPTAGISGRPGERKSGLIAINLAAIIFGSAALFGELDVSPFWIVAARGAFACLALLTVSFAQGGIKSKAAISAWRLLLVSGVLLCLHWLTFFASVQTAGIAIATLTFASFPLFTVFIEKLRERRIPRWHETAAGFVIVLAISVLVDFNDRGPKLSGGLCGIASALSFAFFSVCSKRLTAKVPSITVSFYQNLIVSVCLAPALPFTSPKPETPATWGWLLILGVATTALMHQLYLFALKRLSASTCSGFIALEPVYAILFAALLFHQPLTLWVGVSGALIVGASLVLLRSDFESIHVKEISE